MVKAPGCEHVSFYIEIENEITFELKAVRNCLHHISKYDDKFGNFRLSYPFQ